MSRPNTLCLISVVIAALILGGCDLLDPVRPTPQPDTDVFGNLLETNPSPDNPGTLIATVRVAVPRDLVRSETDSGATPPEMDKGIVATITVTEDTVVLGEGRSVALEDIAPGTEVVVVPVAGTTFMMGSSAINLEAAYFLDFETFKQWRLPKLWRDQPRTERNDTAAINSDGGEVSPLPVGDGRVLYFSAHLRPSPLADGGWQGARRDGLSEGTESTPRLERSYRTELTDDGWSAPELVDLPGLEEAASVRVSWVSADETHLLVTVNPVDGVPWVGESHRARAGAPWGAVERLERLGEDAADAVYLAGSETKVTFVSTRGGGQQTDLFFADLEIEDSPLPLEPKVNTVGNEWGPRVGPDNELYFMRGDRQMLLQDGRVVGLRLPGPHRSVFGQVAVSADGRWAFFCVPAFLPVELDQDIFVASVDVNGLGEPVPVDDWRPTD